MKNILTLAMLFALCNLYAQENLLTNPSFEDYPRQGKAPREWQDCGFPNESPPDVQPNSDTNYPFFEVTKAPFDGETYLGMVTRDNETWESVAQALAKPLIKGNEYEFEIALCRSKLYVSQSRTTREEANYTTPVTLRVWGGKDYCDLAEMLAVTEEIVHSDWQTYYFSFVPNDDYDYFILEAFYTTPVLFPYNGNLLLDAAKLTLIYPSGQLERLEAMDKPTFLEEVLKKGKFRYRNPGLNKEKSMPIVDSIYLAFQVYEFLTEHGIRQKLYETDETVLMSEVENMYGLGLSELPNLLEELGSIFYADHSKAPLSDADVAMFEEAETYLKEALEVENIRDALLNFAKENRSKIIEELSQ